MNHLYPSTAEEVLEMEEYNKRFNEDLKKRKETHFISCHYCNGAPFRFINSCDFSNGKSSEVEYICKKCLGTGYMRREEE